MKTTKINKITHIYIYKWKSGQETRIKGHSVFMIAYYAHLAFVRFEHSLTTYNHLYIQPEEAI